MRPVWSISADGEDATAKLADYLISLSVTDRDGMESDELAIEVADPLANIAIPRLGARLAVSLGYQATGLVSMGEYVCDSVELSSPPRRMSIRGHAADLREPLKARKTRGFEDTTVGELVDQIAAEHDMAPATGWELRNYQCRRIDQTNESDISFLTRLGQELDAVVTVKAGRLIFARKGEGNAVSGQPIGEITLRPEDVTSWRLSITEAEKYTSAEARYHDTATATDTWTRSGEGDGESVYRLRQTYPDQERAQAAADAKLRAITRGTTSLSITMPGRTDVAAETPLVLSGFAEELDGRWIVTSATHTLDGGGYSLQIDGERAE